MPKFGKEHITLLWELEDLVKKVTDFVNTRRFTLRYSKSGVTPVSLGLKNNIRTPRSFAIIRAGERQLFNKSIRCLNNTINISSVKRDTSINQLVSVWDRDTLKECKVFINRMREARYVREFQRQKSKFSSPWLKNTDGHSNINLGQDQSGKYGGYM